MARYIFHYIRPVASTLYTMAAHSFGNSADIEIAVSDHCTWKSTPINCWIRKTQQNYGRNAATSGLCTPKPSLAPPKSRRARCEKSSILAHILNHRAVFPERRVVSLAVCVPHMDKQFSNFYANDLSLDAERHRVRCTWAFSHAFISQFSLPVRSSRGMTTSPFVVPLETDGLADWQYKISYLT